MADTAEPVALMVERIVRAFAPLRIVLFGSRARGDAAEDSDIDLLVVLGSAANPRAAAVAVRRLLCDLPVAKDILLVSPGDIERRAGRVGDVLRTALAEGRVIYESGVGRRLAHRCAALASLRLRGSGRGGVVPGRFGAGAAYACWLAQQAAEKALKALLVLSQTDFPWRHDLDALRNMLPEKYATRAACPELAALTERAVEARYPGEWPEASAADAASAVEQARAVLASAHGDFGLAQRQAPSADDGGGRASQDAVPEPVDVPSIPQAAPAPASGEAAERTPVPQGSPNDAQARPPSAEPLPAGPGPDPDCPDRS